MSSEVCTLLGKVFLLSDDKKIYFPFFFGSLYFLFFTVKSLIHLQIILALGETLPFFPDICYNAIPIP